MDAYEPNMKKYRSRIEVGMHWMSDLRGILAMPIKGSASMNRLVLHEMSSGKNTINNWFENVTEYAPKTKQKFELSALILTLCLSEYVKRVYWFLMWKESSI